jgi:hypothetical protein
MIYLICLTLNLPTDRIRLSPYTGESTNILQFSPMKNNIKNSKQTHPFAYLPAGRKDDGVS